MASPAAGTVGDAVFVAVCRAYDKLPAKGKPAKTPLEWTMLAGIVARDGAGGYHPIAVATGNKCIGKRDMQADGSVLHDCHAEVLARRAFNRYLLEEMRAHMALCKPAAAAAGVASSSCSGGLVGCHWGLLQHDADCGRTDAGASTGRFTLRPGVTLHLYISDSPCGDAAVYSDAAAPSGTGQGADGCSPSTGAGAAAAAVVEEVAAGASAGQRRTGAKLITSPADGVDASPGASGAVAADDGAAGTDSCAAGALRTKSGRSDLPPERRTLSMCCSDKVARWVACGLQSAVVARWLAAPLFLASVTVSAELLGFNPALGSPSVVGSAATALLAVPPLPVAHSLHGGPGGGGAADAAASPLWPQMAALQRALWTRGATETAAAQSAFVSASSDPPAARSDASTAPAVACGATASTLPRLPVLCVLPQRFGSSRASLATSVSASIAACGAPTLVERPGPATSGRVAGGKRERPAPTENDGSLVTKTTCEPPAKRLAVGVDAVEGPGCSPAGGASASASAAVASAATTAAAAATMSTPVCSSAAAALEAASSSSSASPIGPLTGGSGSGAAIVPSGSSLNAYRCCDGYAKIAAANGSRPARMAAPSGTAAAAADDAGVETSPAPLALATAWTSEGVAASRGCVLGPSLKAPKQQRMSRLCKASIAALAAQVVHAGGVGGGTTSSDDTAGMTYARMKTPAGGAGGIAAAVVASKAAFHAPGGRFTGWLFCSRGCEDFAAAPAADA